MFFQLLICLFSLLTFASAAPLQPKSGCQSTCGNVSIPYPFGIGVGCYQNSGLALNCRESFTPPRLLSGTVVVRNISLSGTMRIAVLVSFDCYNKDRTSSGKFSQEMTLPKLFTFSHNRNKFTAVGTDTATGFGGGILLLLFVAISIWFYGKLKKRRALQRKQEFFKQNGGLLLQQQISSGKCNAEKTKNFVTEELEKATDNFNENRVLGRGGSGTVYKGMLPDGRIVAIKKSKLVDETQICQFINELVILSEINHKNIVKVMGCCLETEVPLLVYEFVSRGTLSEHLHGKNLISSISWEDRLRICKEIAGALAYLHSSLCTPIFHRDIKSSNILLDENFKAKVSDFGISRSVPYEQTHLSTLVRGTFGYLDPEYFHSGQFTEKSDVYGFGVVLVEVLTGQKPISFTRSEEEANLAMQFISSVKEDRVLQILETRIANEARKEEIQIVASLAKKCLKLVGKKRPTMTEVLIQLENLRVFQHQESLRLLTQE